MTGVTAKTRIAIGLAGLLVSIMLTAMFLGVVPDREGAMRAGRASLAEAIAANSSILISREDIRRLGADLEMVVERNEGLLSAGIRTASNSYVVEIGDHKTNWTAGNDSLSTDSQVQVPIMAGGSEWGRMELRYEPLRRPGWTGFLTSPWVVLLAFVTATSFFSFRFYLGKMLKHLDPSQAIPGRVRSALDTMAGGLLVVDRKQQIVLANTSFAALVQKNPDDLIGLRTADFPWTGKGGEQLDAAETPWRAALDEKEAIRNRIVRLQLGKDAHRTFMVSCSPVFVGEDQVGGALISFDDVTQLEETEIELRKSKKRGGRGEPCQERLHCQRLA